MGHRDGVVPLGVAAPQRAGTFAVGVFVLLAVSLAAGPLPGRGAAQVDAIVALRYE